MNIIDMIEHVVDSKTRLPEAEYEKPVESIISNLQYAYDQLGIEKCMSLNPALTKKIYSAAVMDDQDTARTTLVCVLGAAIDSGAGDIVVVMRKKVSANERLMSAFMKDSYN